MAKTRIKRATFRHIEAELAAYFDTLNNLEILRQDIILAGRTEEKIGRASGSSIVERRATKLADWHLLKEMERITQAIAKVYEETTEKTREVLWVRYNLKIDWEPDKYLEEKLKDKRFKMSPEIMAFTLDIDISTLHRHKKAFIYMVAERLGWY